NFGATAAQGQASALTEDADTNQGVGTVDYVASRDQSGSTEALPNGTTPGNVTTADDDAVKAELGAAVAEGQQAARSASTVVSQSAFDVAIASDAAVPATVTSVQEDEVTPSQNSTDNSTPTVSAAANENLPVLQRRGAVCSIESLDLAMSQQT